MSCVIEKDLALKIIASRFQSVQYSSLHCILVYIMCRLYIKYTLSLFNCSFMVWKPHCDGYMALVQECTASLSLPPSYVFYWHTLLRLECIE